MRVFCAILKKFANKDFANALDALLPQKLIPVIIRLSGIDARKNGKQCDEGRKKASGWAFEGTAAHDYGDNGL